MPFRLRSVPVLRVFSVPCVEKSEGDLNSGVTIDKVVNVYDTLPDVEDYKLKTLLDAGIPLQKVSTKLIHSGISEVTEYLDKVKAPSAPSVSSAPSAPSAEGSNE